MVLMQHPIPTREWEIDKLLKGLTAKLVLGTLTPVEKLEMQHLSAERSRLMTRMLFGNRRRGLRPLRPELMVRKKRHG